MLQRLCVFCGSRVGGNPLYIERTRQLALALAERGIGLVYGAQLKIQAKPVGLLNIAGFFDPLLTWIERCIQDDFLKPRCREFLLVDDDANRILDALARISHQP